MLLYIEDPDYGQTDDRPYLCAAVTYTSSEQDSHEFKLHFSDWAGYSYTNLPSQLNMPVDKYHTLS